jgi:hypothetical protein
MGWIDQHCCAFHRLMRRRTLNAEMVASAAVVELNCSNLCKGTSLTASPLRAGRDSDSENPVKFNDVSH